MKIEDSGKACSHWESSPGLLAWVASALSTEQWPWQPQALNIQCNHTSLSVVLNQALDTWLPHPPPLQVPPLWLSGGAYGLHCWYLSMGEDFPAGGVWTTQYSTVSWGLITKQCKTETICYPQDCAGALCCQSGWLRCVGIFPLPSFWMLPLFECFSF